MWTQQQTTKRNGKSVKNHKRPLKKRCQFFLQIVMQAGYRTVEEKHFERIDGEGEEVGG
jgi:hypothetical protein